MKDKEIKPDTSLFHVTGMHCRACVSLIESELQEHPRVVSAISSLQKHSVEVSGDFGGMSQEALADEFTALLTKHGYSLTVERTVPRRAWGDFRWAVPIALLLIGVFVLLQKLELVDLIHAQEVSLGTTFFIGVIASLSSCLAVVGGLVLSVSATFAKGGDSVKPQLLFHSGRLITFFLLGGVIGAFGARFALSPQATVILGVLTSIVMFILGLNLLDLFSWAKVWQPTLPRFFSTHALRLAKLNHRLTPFLLGVITFFLPCGFTQSMQLYTLSAGSFLDGALTMLVFALGTLPVLALVSFSSLGVRTSMHLGVFFKTAGLLVIAFALFMLLNSMVAAGWLSPVW